MGAPGGPPTEGRVLGSASVVAASLWWSSTPIGRLGMRGAARA